MLSIIVAIGKNNSIGKNNKLLWNIKNDLKRFKEITLNKTVIMGRKTFESIGKPLPNRKNIIITKNLNYKNNFENIKIENNLQATLEKYKNLEEEVFIIGGEKIYKEAFLLTEKLYITKIYKDFEADVFLELDYTNFKEVYKSEVFINDDGLEYQYFNYERKK